MIDTHAHLDLDDFKHDLDTVIKNAKKENIEYIINIGFSLETCKSSIALSKKYPFIFSVLGLHPHEADNITLEMFETVSHMLDTEKVVGIGEVGLDYFRNLSNAENQKKWFAKFVQLAYEKKYPLVIHCREAEQDTFEILNNETLLNLPGVFHCFAGDIDFAKKILDMGFYISFAGNVSYPKAENLRETAKYVPLNRILLETDCPYLAPQQKRGKRNEPAFLKFSAELIAEIKDVSVDKLDKVTSENAKKVFNLHRVSDA